MKKINIPTKLWPSLCLILTFLVGAPAYAVCSSPAGKEGDIVYNSDYHTYQFCNNTNWLKYQWGYSWGSQSSYNPTPAPGSGFFVLTSTTYDFNLGGLAGGNAKCLTELTGNTNWRGYSTANSNGQLIAGKVKAFLCVNGGCNNLTASTVYNFAKVGDATAGGATFTTDGSGLGPNDAANWAAANYFSGTYTYIAGPRWASSGTVWSSTPLGGNTCTELTSSSGTYDAVHVGISNYVDNNRWGGTFTSVTSCAQSLPIVCFVNP